VAEREAVAFTLHLPEKTDLASFQTRTRDCARLLYSETLRWAEDAGWPW